MSPQRKRKSIPNNGKKRRFGPETQAELPRLIENPFALGGSALPTLVSVDICNAERDRFVNGIESKSWKKDEREGFLLGLYIFEKNLALATKFVGTKKTGDGVRFYYSSDFHHSDEYRLWSKGRKPKASRFYGKELFTGTRGDTILSRLLPRTENDLRNVLIKNSTKFRAERLSLEEYVFEMKGMVGVPALVEAVGIGKEIGDLTQPKPEPMKRTYQIAPSVKYSSLTSSELTTILNQHFKLSKIQMRDLFEKAFWPHLQARGWHYERLENYQELGLKNPTVFVVDGEKFFSAKLVAGKQYFNSIKSMLNEVLSNSHLLNATKNEACPDKHEEQESTRREEKLSSPSRKRGNMETQVRSSGGNEGDMETAWCRETPSSSGSDESPVMETSVGRLAMTKRVKREPEV